MTQHTPKRLKVRKGFDDGTFEIFEPDRSIRKPFIETPIATVEIGGKEGKAFARRLVACWNACEGIDTKLLEDLPPGVINAEHATKLETEHAARIAAQVENEALKARLARSGVAHLRTVDVLTRALRAIVEESNDPGAVDCARAAIAKVEGGAA